MNVTNVTQIALLDASNSDQYRSFSYWTYIALGFNENAGPLSKSLIQTGIKPFSGVGILFFENNN